MATGKATATTRIAAPTALAGGGDVLYATDGKTVYSLTREAAQPSEFITALKSVRCMAVDPATGDLLLFDGGR